MDRWWVIHDDSIRWALQRVESGVVSKEEAYADLCEHAEVEDVPGGDELRVGS